MGASGVVQEQAVVQVLRSGGYKCEFERLERWKAGRVVVEIAESGNDDIVGTVDVKRTKRRKCVEDIWRVDLVRIFVLVKGECE